MTVDNNKETENSIDCLLISGYQYVIHYIFNQTISAFTIFRIQLKLVLHFHHTNVLTQSHTTKKLLQTSDNLYLCEKWY